MKKATGPHRLQLAISNWQLAKAKPFSRESTTADRAKRELGYKGEIWQPGFSEVRITDRASFLKHRKYIEQNPVKAGLADKPENYPYGSAYFKKRKRRG